jgi:hypothetical protein
MKTAALGLALTVLPGVAAADWDQPNPAPYSGYESPQRYREERPPCPSPQHTWVEARWENDRGRQVYRQGYWQAPAAYQSDYGAEAEVWVGTPPPPPRYEARSRAPYAAAVWIPGFWQWNGRHHGWVAGHWTSGRPGYVWEESRWRRHGHRWGYSRGHWRRR